MEIYKQEKLNKATGGPSVTATSRSVVELAYQKKVESHLIEENCYKIYFVSYIHDFFYKQLIRISVRSQVAYLSAKF